MKTKRIVIRKYGNRRLYNTSDSRYINLDDLAALVRNGNDVQVVDAKTGEDLTRVTLTQVIVEDARNPGAGLPLDVLRQLIMASHQIAREGMTWFQPAFDALRGAASSPYSPVQMMRNLVGGSEAGDSASEELQDLKRRIAELEKRKSRPKKARTAKRRKTARHTGH
jgi:polyhydroxyalkanoate synthesis repressor PhaR